MLENYPYKTVGEEIYEINEFDGVSVFLIEGSEKALLVDTGAGIGNLRKFAEGLARHKPLEVFITHNHRDHAGNAPLFEKVAMSATDLRIGPIIRPWTSKASRLRFVRRSLETFPDRVYPWTEEDLISFTPDQEPAVTGVEDGYLFDLGGRRVRCISCPGHTPGSMALLDDRTGTLFTGDCCGENVGLGVRPLENPAMEHASMEEAAEGLRRLLTMDFDPARVFSAHTDHRVFGEPLKAGVIEKDIYAMEQILRGNCEIKTQEIPVLDLYVEYAMVDGVSIQFHSSQLQKKNQEAAWENPKK